LWFGKDWRIILSGLDKFTQSARKVLSLAHLEAERMQQPMIGS